jgi:class 3 adenylate cyclase/tetratricopeptide (TPR) repeat protein
LSFVAKLQRAREVLEQQGRLSVRALGRELEISGDELEEVIEELIEIQGVAEREGNALSWLSGAESLQPPASPPRRDPRSYTPRHLAERILRSKSALEGERKQVTVLFADVKGSMEISEQVDPEEWHGILDHFFRILSDGVHRFEGTVNQYTGDGIMALFGAPIAHEDHAHRACYAALHLRDALRRFSQELRRESGLDLATRIGLNSGEVVVGKIGDDLRMDYTAQGQTVGLAQRMEQLAEAGKAYVAESTARAVEGFFEFEDLGAFNVKGASEPVRAFALEGVGALRTRFDRSRARGLSRFVGRDDEMRVLEAALERADQSQGQVVAIAAEAGTGKSRLCFEFLERCRAKGANVLEAQALAHGKSIPMRPILELFRQRFGIEERDEPLRVREKIAGPLLLLDPAFADLLPSIFEFLGVPDPERPASPMDPPAMQRRLLDDFKRIVHADSRDRTFVTLIEDLHWLDEASEEFVAALVDVATATRNVVLLNFRPEYRADWLNRPTVQQIALQPLDPEAVREMLAETLGSDPSVAGLPERIHERTGGNPFFSEEIVHALVEERRLEGTTGAYRLIGSLDDVPLPDSVHNVLAARIDRLVLQTASVIGREVPRPMLAAVCHETEGELDAALRALCQAELLLETSLYPVVEYLFKHALTQDVAYGSQLAESRAAVHRAVANEIETRHADDLDEKAAELAWHWTQAGEPGVAARWHGRAADWMFTRDVRESTRHWHAVMEALPEVPERTEEKERLVDACRWLLTAGWATGISDEEADEILARGLRAAEHHGDVRALGQLHWAFAAARITVGAFSEGLEHQRTAIPLLEEGGDLELRTASRLSLAALEGFVGDLDAVDAQVDAFFDEAPDDPTFGFERSGFAPYPLMWSWRAYSLQLRGRPGVGDALRRAREAARKVAPASGPVLAALTELYVGEIRGELPGALELAADAMKRAEAYGAPNVRVAARAALARAHALRGDWPQAVELFEASQALSHEHRALMEWEGHNVASLAHAYLEAGQPETARETALRGVSLSVERESPLQELENRLALARTERALGNAEAVVPLLERCEALIAETGAVVFRPHLEALRD